jgi:AraC-like DNA-binding protein
VLDLAQTLDTRATAFENLTLIVPRPMLAGRMAQPEALHGLVLPRDSAMASLLAHHFEALFGHAPRMTFDECHAVADGSVALIVACLRGELERRDAASSGPAALSLIRIRQHIESRLSHPDLSAESVASHFGLSRASLYRLFAPLGGVAEYIRSRRLHRAFFDLAVPGAQGPRVSEGGAPMQPRHGGGLHPRLQDRLRHHPTRGRETALLGSRPSAGGRGKDGATPALTRWMRRSRRRGERVRRPGLTASWRIDAGLVVGHGHRVGDAVGTLGDVKGAEVL